ncbi:MAG TPA: hypothetical protein VEB03_00565 [Candidatus Nanoarchaeia archaeon]|nr:hypothetical protein [Candidatus Nanoarchaeia archaeon]
MKRLIELLFCCQHKHTSRVFTDEEGQYQVCFDCGTHIPYSAIDFERKAVKAA